MVLIIPHSDANEVCVFRLSLMSTSLVLPVLTMYTNYVLVYNKDTKQYNTGYPYDPETKEFEFPPGSGVPAAHAKQLAAIANSIGRVTLFTAMQSTSAATGAFFVDNQHIITSSDILFPSTANIPPLEEVQFKSAAFSRRALLDTGMYISFCFFASFVSFDSFDSFGVCCVCVF